MYQKEVHIAHVKKAYYYIILILFLPNHLGFQKMCGFYQQYQMLIISYTISKDQLSININISATAGFDIKRDP